MLGDEFFKEVFPVMQELCRLSKVNKTPAPYLYEYYNVFGYYTPSTTTHARRVIAWVLNSFIHGLNMRERLPRFLVIILDKDLILDVNIYDYGATRAIKENLKWLCKQIDIFVKCKRLEITNIKPGTVCSTDPKIVLVCMLKRPLVFPRNCSMEQALSVRNRFNQALNKVADDFGLNVLSVESCDSPRFFNNLGGLNQMGKGGILQRNKFPPGKV